MISAARVVVVALLYAGADVRLEQARVAAKVETWEVCLKSQFDEIRYMPLTMLVDICDRLVLQRHGRPRY